MGNALQFLDAFNTDDISPRTFDVGTHGIEECNKIDDFRFFCCIFNDSPPLSCCCGHQDIFSSTNAWEIQVNRSPLQTMRCIAFYKAVSNIDFSTHSFKRFKMQVNRPASNHASARKSDLHVPSLLKAVP